MAPQGRQMRGSISYQRASTVSGEAHWRIMMVMIGIDPHKGTTPPSRSTTESRC
jgi:hypothetical protein